MKWIRLSYFWVFLWLVSLAAYGQIPQRPDPPVLVNDFAGILQPAELSELEGILVDFDRETSTQIAVVTVATFQGYDRADFAYRLAEMWGVGQKGKNNGVVILVKPKSAGEKGEVYVAVGYGLEGILPDAVANRLIVGQEMIPRFRENDYYGGILNGVRVIMDLTRGEFTAEQYAEKTGQPLSSGGPGLIILLLVLFLVIFPLMRKGKHMHSSGSRNLPLWLLLGMMNSGGKHSGSWNDFSSGRGSFGGGGFGRGGFGGFGGGSFGGGGAGGSW
jgi:uncharacterized protein